MQILLLKPVFAPSVDCMSCSFSGLLSSSPVAWAHVPLVLQPCPSASQLLFLFSFFLFSFLFLYSQSLCYKNPDTSLKRKNPLLNKENILNVQNHNFLSWREEEEGEISWFCAHPILPTMPLWHTNWRYPLLTLCIPSSNRICNHVIIPLKHFWRCQQAVLADDIMVLSHTVELQNWRLN